jgi:hypothetical protein
VAGRWFSPITPVSSTSKTDCHDITEILLKVALTFLKQKCFLSLFTFLKLTIYASGYTFVSLVIVFSVLYDILLLVTLLSLLSLYFLSFTIYCFWLHICLFGHCSLCPLRYTASGYTFVSLVIVFSVLYDILLLITHLSLWSLYFLSFTIYCFWLHICL